MMKRIMLIALMFVSGLTYGQIYQKDPSYGKTFNRGDFDKILQIPGDTVIDGATDKCKLIAKKNGVVYEYSCDSSKWIPLVGASTGNFIKNDTTNYQNGGFSISQPGRINYITDTTGNRFGALEVYRTILNPDAKAPQGIRSVLKAYSTEVGHEDKELTSLYGGLHITSANTQNLTNATEGLIAVAGTASHLGAGDITLMSSFGALLGNAPANTGVINKAVFYKVTSYDANSNPGKISNLAGFAQPKLTPGAISNINWLSGIGDATTSGGMLGNAIWPGGNWNMYDASTYKSFHSGNLMVGDTVETFFPLRVAGKAKITDTAYISKIVAGVLNTDKILLKNYSSSLSPVSIDTNGIAAGTTTGISGTLLNISKVYANHGSNIVGIRSTPQAFERIGTHTFGLSAGTFQPIITGANTQNWNTSVMQGISVAPTISSGASGIISNVYAETVTRTFNSATATVDTLVYKRTYKSTESTPSTVNNEIFDLVGISGSIGGQWSRYDATGYKSYWGTGNQLINSFTDNGFGEKLQVNGRVNASRATRGSNLVTKDQLDSAAALIPTAGSVILNQTSSAQSGAGFWSNGSGRVDGNTFRVSSSANTDNYTSLETSTVDGVVRANNSTTSIRRPLTFDALKYTFQDIANGYAPFVIENSVAAVDSQARMTIGYTAATNPAPVDSVKLFVKGNIVTGSRLHVAATGDLNIMGRNALSGRLEHSFASQKDGPVGAPGQEFIIGNVPTAVASSFAKLYVGDSVTVGGGYHGIGTYDVVQSSSSSLGAYAALDVRSQLVGSTGFNHYVGLQSRPGVHRTGISIQKQDRIISGVR
jgi:hypothetical protein